MIKQLSADGGTEGANKMSKHSLNIAVKYGESLREFRDQSEAEDYYISYKDDTMGISILLSPLMYSDG